MAFPEVSMTFADLAKERGRNIMTRANQTDAAIVKLFIAGYEHLWKVRDGLLVEELQAAHDATGSGVVQALTKASDFATDNAADLDSLYHTAPYSYTVDMAHESGNPIRIGAMKQEWIDELALEDV